MDKGHVTLLILLDLRAAFDSVDHCILPHRLQFQFGVRGNALLWFKSYLVGRTQHVSVNETLSKKCNLNCGVPQGSCLGPLLFTIYASILFDILESYLPSIRSYVNDTQLMYGLIPLLTPNARWEPDVEMKQKIHFKPLQKKVDKCTFVDSVANELVYYIINTIMKKNWRWKLCKTLQILSDCKLWWCLPFGFLKLFN